MEQDQLSEQNESSQIHELHKELQKVKAHNAELEDRLVKIESILEILTQSLETLSSPHPIDTMPDDTRDAQETIDEYITEHIQERLSEQNHEVDTEGVSTNWNYIVAKKGGYEEILYMTVQDFLSFEKDPVEFLTFLLEKRNEEVKESLHHLQEEYGKLEGHRLHKHFTQLWKLHHALLKKKAVRTWKEEVFLEAFDAFIAWLQH